MIFKKQSLAQAQCTHQCQPDLHSPFGPGLSCTALGSISTVVQCKR